MEIIVKTLTIFRVADATLQPWCRLVMCVHMQAVIKGLTAQTAFNGQTCKLKSFDTRFNRWSVLLPDTTSDMAHTVSEVRKQHRTYTDSDDHDCLY